MYFNGRCRNHELIQKLKIPWSGLPNCPAPASTPQRLIHTGKLKVSPYSSAIASDASFVLP